MVQLLQKKAAMKPANSIFALSALTLLALLACARTPHTKPVDMSAADHNAEAASHESAARVQLSQYNPDASVENKHCGRGGTTHLFAIDTGSCWTSLANPTDAHLEKSKRFHKMAADHRKASRALVDAETKACSGVSEWDQEMSPFSHDDDIASVEPLMSNTGTSTPKNPVTVGAVVTFKPVRGLTSEGLQRLVDCHLARNLAAGFEMPEMDFCPLALKGVQASVGKTNAGVAVAIESKDPKISKEIWRRAQNLVHR